MRTPDRLIYGSDANAMNTARFRENLQPIHDMAVSDEIKNKILCETAKKLLKIK
jgi:predicted TIM-barrel fold metal-dependent hydrolase